MVSQRIPHKTYEAPNHSSISWFHSLPEISVHKRRKGLDYQLLCSNITGSNLTHLVGSQGEIEYLGLLKSSGEESEKIFALAAQLLHQVPQLEEVSISQVIKLRNLQRDAFVLYREAMDQIIREHLEAGGGLTDIEVREIQADILEPRLAKLRIEASVFAKSQRRKALLKAGSAGALLALGVVGGVLPSGWAELAKAVGAFSIARDIVETGLMGNQPSTAETDELYFLLKIQGGH